MSQESWNPWGSRLWGYRCCVLEIFWQPPRDKCTFFSVKVLQLIWPDQPEKLMGGGYTVGSKLCYSAVSMSPLREICLFVHRSHHRACKRQKRSTAATSTVTMLICFFALSHLHFLFHPLLCCLTSKWAQSPPSGMEWWFAKSVDPTEPIAISGDTTAENKGECCPSYSPIPDKPDRYSLWPQILTPRTWTLWL